jgi:prepilin-type N-terminal cleavage/methylation domain-containing protein
MEEKKFSWRYGALRTLFNSFYSVYSIFWRKNNFAYRKATFLKLKTSNLKLQTTGGFTLIEIITAIGVLTILATVILAAVNPIEQFRKAQDAKRKSDLAQVQRVLEAYYQDFGRYPAHTTTGLNTYTINTGLGEDVNAIKWGTSWKPYMDIVPVDPSSSKFYVYFSDSSNGYQSYRIYASLDRGTKDPDACSEATGCPNAPGGCGLEDEFYCNFGLTSPNVSP